MRWRLLLSGQTPESLRQPLEAMTERRIDPEDGVACAAGKREHGPGREGPGSGVHKFVLSVGVQLVLGFFEGLRIRSASEGLRISKIRRPRSGPPGLGEVPHPAHWRRLPGFAEPRALRYTWEEFSEYYAGKLAPQPPSRPQGPWRHREGTGTGTGTGAPCRSHAAKSQRLQLPASVRQISAARRYKKKVIASYWEECEIKKGQLLEMGFGLSGKGHLGSEDAQDSTGDRQFVGKEMGAG